MLLDFNPSNYFENIQKLWSELDIAIESQVFNKELSAFKSALMALSRKSDSKLIKERIKAIFEDIDNLTSKNKNELAVKVNKLFEEINRPTIEQMWDNLCLSIGTPYYEKELKAFKSAIIKLYNSFYIDSPEKLHATYILANCDKINESFNRNLISDRINKLAVLAKQREESRNQEISNEQSVVEQQQEIKRKSDQDTTIKVEVKPEIEPNKFNFLDYLQKWKALCAKPESTDLLKTFKKATIEFRQQIKDDKSVKEWVGVLNYIIAYIDEFSDANTRNEITKRVNNLATIFSKDQQAERKTQAAQVQAETKQDMEAELKRVDVKVQAEVKAKLEFIDKKATEIENLRNKFFELTKSQKQLIKLKNEILEFSRNQCFDEIYFEMIEKRRSLQDRIEKLESDIENFKNKKKILEDELYKLILELIKLKEPELNLNKLTSIQILQGLKSEIQGFSNGEFKKTDLDEAIKFYLNPNIYKSISPSAFKIREAEVKYLITEFVSELEKIIKDTGLTDSTRKLLGQLKSELMDLLSGEMIRNQLSETGMCKVYLSPEIQKVIANLFGKNLDKYSSILGDFPETSKLSLSPNAIAELEAIDDAITLTNQIRAKRTTVIKALRASIDTLKKYPNFSELMKQLEEYLNKHVVDSDVDGNKDYLLYIIHNYSQNKDREKTVQAIEAVVKSLKIAAENKTEEEWDALRARVNRLYILGLISNEEARIKRLEELGSEEAEVKGRLDLAKNHLVTLSRIRNNEIIWIERLDEVETITDEVARKERLDELGIKEDEIYKLKKQYRKNLERSKERLVLFDNFANEKIRIEHLEELSNMTDMDARNELRKILRIKEGTDIKKLIEAAKDRLGEIIRLIKNLRDEE